MRMMALVLVCFSLSATAQLRAGVARESINPMEAKIPTQLGGYGAREGRPAEGTLDTIYGKVLVLEYNGQKSALVTMDACSVPVGMVAETLTKAHIEGLDIARTMVCASHSHTGLEGFSLDRRNIADNPNIGIFSEPMLNFVTDRLAKALMAANAALQPVTAGSGMVPLPNMNHNRRDGKCVDDQLTALRLDKADGKPLAVFVNYTAHGTFVDDTEMLVSSEWAGSMQRTVEDLMGEGVTCLYANGAEGDCAPTGKPAGSPYEQAWNYGREVGVAAWRLADKIETKPVTNFAVASKWVMLPERKSAPDFIKIAGDEYKVTQDQIDLLLKVMFPDQAPIFAFRLNDFQMMTFPGEPICEIGTAVKDALRKDGVAHPCVASLTTDHIGYILTAEEYNKSGYEVTASFYGGGLGKLLQDEEIALGAAVAAGGK
jgi:hypothetical protein